jgi:hypothetical protein
VKGALERRQGPSGSAPARWRSRALPGAWLHLNDDRYALDLGPLPQHRTAVAGNSGVPVLVPAAVARTRPR